MGNEEQIAAKTIENIVETINNADTEAFMNLFSEQARENTPKLNEEFNQLIECISGNIESYKKVSVATYDSAELGQLTRGIEFAFEVKTAMNAFVCLAYEVIKDTSDSKNIGVYWIRVYSNDTYEELLSVGEDRFPI